MQQELPKAVGLPRRMAALLYDGLLLFGVLFVASLAIMLPFDVTYGSPLYPLYILYIYVVAFLYLGWFWTHAGQTLGMKTWHIRVQARDGGPPSWRAAALRFLSALLFWLPAAGLYLGSEGRSGLFSMLGLLPLLLDYLWCFRNPQRMALHDLMSGTRLVRDTQSRQTGQG